MVFNSLARALIAGLTGTVLLTLPACSNDPNSTPPLTGGFRAANGITDSDSNGLDATVIDVFKLNDIAFGAGSGIRYPPLGSYKARLDVNGQGFDVEHVEISHNDLATVFTYGTVAAATFGGFIAYESLSAPSNTEFIVQPLHSAYQTSLTTPTLSYYFVAAGSEGIGSATPVMAPFATQTATRALPAGNYRIIVTDGTNVIYDSGASATGVTLPPSGTNVLQVAALDAPGSPSGSTISLLMLDNGGGSTQLLNGAH